MHKLPRRQRWSSVLLRMRTTPAFRLSRCVVREQRGGPRGQLCPASLCLTCVHRWLWQDTVSAVLQSLDTYYEHSVHLEHLLRVVAAITKVVRLAETKREVSNAAAPAPAAARPANGPNHGADTESLTPFMLQTLAQVRIASRSRPGRGSGADSDDSDNELEAEEYFQKRIAARKAREAAHGKFNGMLADLEDTADGLESMAADNDGTGDAVLNDDDDSDDAVAATPHALRRRVVRANLREVVDNLMRRTRHFLGGPTPRAVLVALDVLQEGAHALRGVPKVLHPLLHDLWPSIAARVSDPSAAVRARAVQLLMSLVVDARCGEFLARRFVSQTWPAMRDQLRSGCDWTKVSLLLHAPARGTILDEDDGDGNGSSSRLGRVGALTAQNRVHLAILVCVAAVAPHLSLSADTVHAACVASRPFLSSRAPPQLQEAAMDVVQALYRVNAPCVWWFLAQLVAGDATLMAAAGVLAPKAALAGAAVKQLPQSMRPNLQQLWLRCVGGSAGATSGRDSSTGAVA